jgi:hypothetical protein
MLARIWDKYVHVISQGCQEIEISEITRGWDYGLVIECLLILHKVMCPIASMAKTDKQNMNVWNLFSFTKQFHFLWWYSQYI